MAFTPRPNKFPGKCACGTPVAAAAGFLGPKVDGRWTVVCTPCQTGEKAPEPKVEKAHELTEEQQYVVDLFSAGKTIAVEAGAGAGKTSTLLALGDVSKGQRGQYLAFNRAIVEDAKTKFALRAPHIRVSTIHSLAFAAIGKKYQHRFGGGRNAWEIAKQLRIEPFFYQLNGEDRVIQPNTLAAYARKAVIKFSESADPKVSVKHQLGYVDGIDSIDPESHSRDYLNNDKLKAHLQRYAEDLWADYSLTDGQLPGYNQSFYLKLWALSDPKIDVDFILVDEAQDLDGVMIQILANQTCQIVYVGDSQQSIYGWRGAINALTNVAVEETAWLTHSFRFGPEIAQVANDILSTISDAKLRLVGAGRPGKVEELEPSDINCILTRSNAGAIGAALNAIENGLRPHLVGDQQDVKSFVRAALKLQQGQRVEHPELAAFESWSEVEDYVAHDPEGADLKVWVQLIKRYGCQQILDAVSGSETPEAQADLVISTAHKSKGREWDNVQVYSDWNPENDTDEEKRLVYVAVTRARLQLDITICQAAQAFVGFNQEDHNEEGS